LLARAGLLEAKECDPGHEEAVKSIIYAAPRTDVKELHTVRTLLADKFGKEFALIATDNKDGSVSKRVTDRLRVEPPKQELVEAYLSTIAEAYGVQWPRKTREQVAAEAAAAEDDEEEDNDDENNPSGGQKVKASLNAPLEADTLKSPPRDLGPKSPVSVVPPSPSTDNMQPRIKLPGPPDLKPGAKMRKAEEKRDDVLAATPTKKKVVDGPGGKIPDVDELAKRFAQLKR